MTKIKSTLLIMILSMLIISGCSSEKEVEQYEKQYNHIDNFIELDVNDYITEEVESDTEFIDDADPIFQEQLKEEEENNIDYTNVNEQYSELYQSNINVNIEEIDIDIFEYEWFAIPEDEQPEFYNIYQYIIYGINTYYNGNITDKYTCNLPDDITEMVTNVIFKVKVHGETSELELSIDMYNNNIVVSEVE